MQQPESMSSREALGTRKDELHGLEDVPLLETLLQRRSRRFGRGMRMEQEPLVFRSRHSPLPLTEDEEALLAFAACGITGHALIDMSLGPGQGGTIMAGLVGRTASSPDAVQAVSVVVTNDQATYLLKRPQDFHPTEIPELVKLAHNGAFTELYRRSRVKIRDGRAAPPLDPPFNITANQWTLYAPGSTYVLPICEVTFFYISALLEAFDERFGAFILDERATFQPAGLRRFARSKGGHLQDDPRAGRVLTVQRAELLIADLVTTEQGMVLQNLGLMAHAMGLGGFPNYAAHDYAWLQALGFRFIELPASTYLGASRILSLLMRLLGRDFAVPCSLGLERDGTVLLKPYCPPYYASMADAVRAVVDAKVGPQGVFRAGITNSAWREPQMISRSIPNVSEAAIEATIAYCEYIYRRYKRFPAYLPPLRTVIGFQASHLDTEFYDRYYRPEALSELQRQHVARWHASEKGPPEAPSGPKE